MSKIWGFSDNSALNDSAKDLEEAIASGDPELIEDAQDVYDFEFSRFKGIFGR